MKKLVYLLVSLFSFSVLTNCGGGSTPPPSPQILHRITSETEEVSITSRKMVEGADYIGTITVNAGVAKTLSDLEYVHVGNNSVDIKEYCTYEITESSLDKEAKLTIPKDYITDNIKFAVSLGESSSYTISIDRSGGQTGELNYVRIEPEIVYEGTEYTGTIIYDSQQYGNPLTLPPSLSSVKADDSEVDCKDACDYKVIDKSKRKATITIPGKYITNNTNVKLALSTYKTHKVYTSVEQLSIKNDIAYDCINYNGRIEVKNNEPDMFLSIPNDANRIYAHKEGGDKIDITEGCIISSGGANNRIANLFIPGLFITNDDADIEVVMLTKKFDPDFTITTSTSNATLEPGGIHLGMTYTGTITAAEGYTLPATIEKVELDYGHSKEDITEQCSYVLTGKHNTAEITIPSTLTNANILVTLTPIKKLHNKWYDYADWWNYCSNGVEDVQATDEDIGIEVDVDFGDNKIMHKVRLIGVDHDDSASEIGTVVHCTFEFANAITIQKDNNSFFRWNSGSEPGDVFHKDNNCDYRISLIEDVLNDIERRYIPTGYQCIIPYLPNSLQSVLKPVIKSVAVNTSEKEGASNYEVKTYNPQFDRCPKLFLLSKSEMGLYDGMDEGEIYEYYKKPEATYIKTIAGDEGIFVSRYWLRSPDIYDITKATTLNYSGKLEAYEVCDTNVNIAPAFCI